MYFLKIFAWKILKACGYLKDNNALPLDANFLSFVKSAIPESVEVLTLFHSTLPKKEIYNLGFIELFPVMLSLTTPTAYITLWKLLLQGLQGLYLHLLNRHWTSEFDWFWVEYRQTNQLQQFLAKKGPKLKVKNIW